MHSETEKLKLLQRVRRDYDVSIEQLSFGDVSVEFFRVANPNEVELETVTGQTAQSVEDSPHRTWQPYWVESWESAPFVCQALAAIDLKSQRVLDLGCGLGVTGAVAAARGAQVLMVDAAQPALLFAQLNTWPWRTQVELRRFDWYQDELSEAFDLIVGSDILYDKEDWLVLERLWIRSLAPGGRVLLGEPGRRVGDAFLEWIGDRDWSLLVDEKVGSEAGKRFRLVWLERA